MNNDRQRIEIALRLTLVELALGSISAVTAPPALSAAPPSFARRHLAAAAPYVRSSIPCPPCVFLSDVVFLARKHPAKNQLLLYPRSFLAAATCHTCSNAAMRLFVLTNFVALALCQAIIYHSPALIDDVIVSGDTVVIGAVNSLNTLSKKDLQQLYNVTTGPVRDSQLCSADGKSCLRDVKPTLTDVRTKVLIRLPDGILHCASVRQVTRIGRLGALLGITLSPICPETDGAPKPDQISVNQTALITSNSTSSLICTTPAGLKIGKSARVVVRTDKSTVTLETPFEYRPDPVVTGIYPHSTFRSGGRTVSIQTIRVSPLEGGEMASVDIHACDAVCQIKQKAIDVIYRHVPHSQRPSITQFDLHSLADSGQSSWSSLDRFSPVYSPSQYYHLTNPLRTLTIDKRKKIDDSIPKSIPEVYLTRLLTSKGTVQTYVEDFLESVLYMEDASFPPILKYFFDLLDREAATNGILSTDSEALAQRLPQRLSQVLNVCLEPEHIYSTISDYQ
ncbi:unnamed protein product [Caenorhabditis auriculariae]|uniref:Uncharacterized protein n=1 Tax=Caenorhabditis auriculariae TaxID=2777116 RepID=A0A8S1HTI1_9PELO|nr:unnamed protein product [Caenorhabditis auriculariae]